MENIGGISSLGGDKFQINNQVMSLAELIMFLEIERANNLEQQLADELQSMAALNNLLKQANAMLSIARTEKGKLEGEGHSTMPPEMIDFFEKNDIQQGLSKYDKEHKGVPHSGLYLDSDGYDFCQNSDEWETSIENLKAFIDGLNSRSQLEMIRISSLMKKRDESLTLPSNTNSNIHQTNQGILGKI
ncbi:hypothetical protein [Hahella sp. HN01]|uniref:hypothetical protein n=1 Tax=Hahella sp. HN01 TaxID=2847262 RepID=UPI001C1F190B|nr:hypothetical protein [Hahella sp. HN01]MBU6955273.1 hypothetical protein [Hahella sp. HN01]